MVAFGTTRASSVACGNQSSDRNSRFNPVNSRITTYDDALRLWKTDPLVGVGIRLFANERVVGVSPGGEGIAWWGGRGFP